ncbi:MAG: 4Fe-4S binding protein [Desulfobacterales bacterium]|nr:MAG: 4Fe-4S binding protein [Desulfobacterales bacterium]
MNFNKVNSIIPLPLILLITISTGPLWASNAVLVGDYQIQIFTEPDPLIAGREAGIVLKVLRSQDNQPARNSKIYLNIGNTLQSLSSKELELKDNSEYKIAREVDEFGNYELKTVFTNPDIYYIRVAIKELEGEPINAPLKAGFTIQVNRPAKRNQSLILIFFTFVCITVIGIYAIHVRKKITSTDTKGFNYLDIPWIKRLLQSKSLQLTFQVPLMIVFIFLLILAFVDIQDSGKNLSVIVIWTLWWTGIIFTFVLVGRLWCYACPVGAISEWFSRMFKPHRLFPAKLRNLWLANFMFLLLTWLDIQIGVVRNPLVTGLILIAITATAIGIGMVYQRRTFCRYLCPIGGLIGIYSMVSAVELRSKDGEVCISHNRKDCYLGNERGNGCPMFEVIPKMDYNNFCNFCGECIKSCPKNNITLRIRTFFKDVWTSRKRSLDEAVLAVALLGISIFVTGDMLEPWGGWMESAMNLFPAQLLGIEYQYTVEVMTKSILFFGISLLVIPGLILLAAAFSNFNVGNGNHNGIKQTFITFGYMFIPIGLSMHLAHNIGHLLNESRVITPALQRVINTYTIFNTGEPNWQLASAPLIDSGSLYWIQMSCFLIFYLFSIYAGYRLAMNNYQDSHTSFKALVPMIFISFVLMVVNVYLLNLPMAPRHVH